MYNIHNYIEFVLYRKKVITMTIEGVMTDLRGKTSYDLLPAAHKSVSKICNEPFYIGTNFTQISRNLNYRFVLVSAPGATGKSTFGQYVAYKSNAIFWNLADISIGDGTFQGTLYKAVGIANISNYAKDLQTGNTVLVVDAFDEAEIISGRKNVETFLKEANDFLEESRVPSIVLLSRTETAQNIAAFFNDNRIPFAHYEIGHFPEIRAKEFIVKSIERKKPITKAIAQCIDQYFDQVKHLIKDKETLAKFLGYAPVLEAISKHIYMTNNIAKLLSELNEDANEVALINNIMNELLEREQRKCVSAFREKLNSDQDKVPNWGVIYSKEEQLIRVLNYILFSEINADDYPVDGLPEYLIDDYIEMIRTFLPQHPFIQNSYISGSTTSVLDYAGPAFRDFSLANIIMNADYEASADLYYQREAATSHFPSPLFWNHYIDLSNGKINSQHFLYVYEAHKSKMNIGNQAFLDISQDEDGAFATFGISEGNELVESETLEVEVPYDVFKIGSISNASINIAGSVVIGSGDNVSITDSFICCDRLVIAAKSLTINAFKPSVTSISCKSAMEAPLATPLNISCISSGDIQVDVPNLYEFPKLSRYRYKFDENSSLDIFVFIHNMRKIFSCFRTHKKDMPARDAEKIDFVIVGDNPLRKSIFGFLTEKSVIFRDAHLYKINLEKMSENGISWGALISTNVEQLNPVYDAYCAWAK